MVQAHALPRILTSPDLAEIVGRSAKNVDSYAARGLLAAPTHTYRGNRAWEESAALAWFTKLHEHAVLVPSDELASDDLNNYGIYMCPQSKDHIGLARPESLVLYKSGAGSVFNVKAVETVNQAITGTRPASQRTSKVLRDGVAIGQSGCPMTVFYLEATGAIDSITPGIRKGRYLTTAQVRDAMASGHLKAPTLDEAFPEL